MKNTDEPIIVEQSYQCSLEDLWSAISSQEQMVQWYFQDIPEFKPEIGFNTKFAVNSQDRTFTHLWEVIEVLPQQVLSYKWKYEEYPGDSVVTFDLSIKDNSSHLKLSHNVLESFPNDIPEFNRESGVLGWEYFIQQSLKNYLNPKN